jgi:hypothetical protein
VSSKVRRRGPALGTEHLPPGFPDCPLSLKQWDCPRSSSEHALRLVRKTLLKGRGLLETVPLRRASLLLLGPVREGPTRFEAGRAAHGHAGPGMVGTDY